MPVIRYISGRRRNKGCGNGIDEQFETRCGTAVKDDRQPWISLMARMNHIEPGGRSIPAIGVIRGPPSIRGTSIPRLRRRGEAAAEGVFGDRAFDDELQQVVGAARFVADAGELEAAERLAVDEGAGDRAVQIQIAHEQLRG